MESKENVTEELKVYFSSFDAQTAANLIAEILYHWGVRLTKKTLGSLSTAQKPAQTFFTLMSNLDFDAVKSNYSKSYQRENFYSLDQITKIVDQLEFLEFEDAANAFTNAAYHWLISADLGSVAKEGDSVLETRLKIYENWGLYLGVY